jgi:hypothetical protein
MSTPRQARRYSCCSGGLVAPVGADAVGEQPQHHAVPPCPLLAHRVVSLLQHIGGTADSGKPFARRANGFTAWQQNDPGFRA